MGGLREQAAHIPPEPRLTRRPMSTAIGCMCPSRVDRRISSLCWGPCLRSVCPSSWVSPPQTVWLPLGLPTPPKAAPAPWSSHDDFRPHEAVIRPPPSLLGSPGSSAVKSPLQYGRPLSVQELGSIPRREDALEKEMATTPVFLPGKSDGQRSLAGYSPQGRQEWYIT